jgi:hypothetical protein
MTEMICSTIVYSSRNEQRLYPKMELGLRHGMGGGGGGWVRDLS